MSMEMQFELENLPGWDQQVKKLIKAVSGDQLEVAGIAGAMIVVNAAKLKVVKRTRELSRSIHQETLEKGPASVVIAMGTDKIYGPVHEFGAVIKPRTATALRFQLKDGRWVTASMVHIPARPYMRPAMDENVKQVEGAIVQALNALLLKASGG